MSTPEKMGIAKLVNSVTMYLKLKMYGGDVVELRNNGKKYCGGPKSPNQSNHPFVSFHYE